MSRKPYPTDLTDAEWELLQPLIPPAKAEGRPRTVDTREIINAILYIQHSGCSWRLLPHDLPPWPTVYNYFRVWRLFGVWEKMTQVLEQSGRQIPKRVKKTILMQKVFEDIKIMLKVKIYTVAAVLRFCSFER